jgi:glucose/arabinose dehydrogenase
MRAAVVAVAAIVALGACGSDSEPLPSGPPVTFATPGSGAASTTAVVTTPSRDTAAVTTASPGATGDSVPTGDGVSTGASATTAHTVTTVTTSVPGTAAAPGGSAPVPPSGAAPLADPVIALELVTVAASPTDLAWRAGDPTLFVVEQDGTIRPLRGGVLGDPVLDITDMTEGRGERGLLGLTFTADGTRAYVNFTDDGNGDTHVVEYTVGADGIFDAASARELLMVEQPYGNHNGGNVTIGPDGFLYIGMGDGGSGGDPERRALNVTTLLGKILRIDPTPSGGQPYTIPTDNPFVDVAGARPEIWSVGVRNPWRMSFDRATGDLWFGDVGQGAWEEIDVAWAADGAGRGQNFGWSAFEGSQRYNEDQPADAATPPIHEYEHGDAGCSVSGGAVYRGAAIPTLVGWYVYADYCSGTLSAIRVEDRVLAGTVELGQSSSVSAVREGPDGELYVLSVDGPVMRIVRG